VITDGLALIAVEILFIFCHPEPVEGQNIKRLQRIAGIASKL
jgi:hypothetical protein